MVEDIKEYRLNALLSANECLKYAKKTKEEFEGRRDKLDEVNYKEVLRLARWAQYWAELIICRSRQVLTPEEIFPLWTDKEEHEKELMARAASRRHKTGEKEIMDEVIEDIKKQSKAREDKAATARDLCRLLQTTRNFYDLVSLEYDPQYKDPFHDHPVEAVVATFENGAKKYANVTHDSCSTLIMDVIEQIE